MRGANCDMDTYSLFKSKFDTMHVFDEEKCTQVDITSFPQLLRKKIANYNYAMIYKLR